MASALASEGAAAPVRDEPLTKAGRETTVLFADVIGSTALYERAGDRAAAQAIHNCVKALHAATTASGGRVVRNIGDEIMALFPSASGAAEAATRMHVAVAVLPAVAGQPLALRIGFHTGVVVQRGDDFFGDTVNIASRLAAQATKGQVLTSAQTVQKLSALLRSSTLQLYNVALKGTAAEIALCELVWSKGADITDFPLAQTTRRRDARSLRLKLGEQDIVCRRADDLVTIGRDAASTFVLDEATASRRHCVIERRQQNFVVRDQSANGTYLSFADAATEMVLRREEVVLRGRGWLAFGQPKGEATHVLEFFEEEESDGSDTQ
jgi:adenylate cyclase